MFARNIETRWFGKDSENNMPDCSKTVVLAEAIKYRTRQSVIDNNEI